MNTTIITSQILWPVLFIIWLSILLNHKYYDHIIKELKESNLLIIFISIIGLAFGILIFLSNNNFLSLAEIILFILWIWMVAKSSIFLIFPDLIKQLTKSHKTIEKTFPFMSILWIIIGGYLSYVWYTIYL